MTTHTAAAPARRALSARVGFGLLTWILVTLLAGSSAPTPLYATYQAHWGFSPVTITVIFGVYAFAVLASLLVVGSLSDHVGRRPVLIGALGAQAIVMLLFAFASGLDVLLAARVLQGLATGAAVGAIAVWALAGFYGSLGPSLAAQVGRSSSTVLGGAPLFALAASGALTVLLFHRTEPRRFALAGNGLVILGVAIVLWSVTATSVAGFFAGTMIAGAGFGAGFQGGLRAIVALTGPAERAGVISVAYIVCYLAMGLPAIVAGLLVVHSTVTQTAQEFGLTVIALAAITAVGTIISARRTARRSLSPSLSS